MKGYIYKYTFPDGKVYIGQTRRDPAIRHREHISPVTGPANGGFWNAYSTFHECKFEIIHQVECDDINNLVGILNYAETQFITKYKATDPQYGYNKQMWGHSHTNYLTREVKIIRAKIRVLYEAFYEERMAIYKSVFDKIWNTKLPLNDEEKDFVIKRCINHELFCFPKSFNIENIEENNLEEDVDGLGDGFAIAETLDCVRADIEEETQMEFQEFLQENGSSIAEQALYEYAETNAIVALDQNGNVINFIRLMK